MKNIGINKPCSENWNEMSKNEKGAFCQKCASQVHDFTNKSSFEIKQTLLSIIDQPVCGRISLKQEIELNEEFNLWLNRNNQRSFQSQLIFVLLVVFGLGLFSCENPKDEKKIKYIQTNVTKIIENLDTTKVMMSKESIPKQVVEIEEQVVVGMIEMEEIPQIIETSVNFEPTECLKKDRNEYIYGGAMEISEEYINYLKQEITPKKDESEEYFAKYEAKIFPNPAKNEATFEILLPEKEFFEIYLFDLNGKMLQTIRYGELNQGKFRHNLDLLNLVPGMYMIVINSNKYKETIKFTKI